MLSFVWINKRLFFYNYHLLKVSCGRFTSVPVERNQQRLLLYLLDFVKTTIDVKH